MDSMIAAAARALSSGDPIEALKRVALRDDPPALALRGIAMAQLGEFERARETLRAARRRAGSREPLFLARCLVAEAEIGLAMRDLRSSPTALADAMRILEARSDQTNAAHARLLSARRLLLLGRVQEASVVLAEISAYGMPAALTAMVELAAAEVALRTMRISEAREALMRAREAASRAAIPALRAEVSAARATLQRPAARWLRYAQSDQLLTLEEIQALFSRSDVLVVDALRHELRAGEVRVNLVRRPVLFAILMQLATSWPAEVGRQELIEQVFRNRHPDDTHRARLRVEIGRLRQLIRPLADIPPTAGGFRLELADFQDLAVLAPLADGPAGALTALLSDGAAWSTSALATALGTSQRSVQRALAELEAVQLVRSEGRGRSQRWLAPSPAGFTTCLLLPALSAPA